MFWYRSSCRPAHHAKLLILKLFMLCIAAKSGSSLFQNTLLIQSLAHANSFKDVFLLTPLLMAIGHVALRCFLRCIHPLPFCHRAVAPVPISLAKLGISLKQTTDFVCGTDAMDCHWKCCRDGIPFWSKSVDNIVSMFSTIRSLTATLSVLSSSN